MKYLSEYRDERIALALAAEIAQRTTRSWVLMEICGGQTHTIMRYGLDELFPRGLELVHGPGCPVCVTPLETIDAAIELALRPEVILVSYGDMLRVPGSRSDLFRAKAEGAQVRVVYSPMEALKIARDNSTRKVVFLAIGFETTAPANAMACTLRRMFRTWRDPLRENRRGSAAFASAGRRIYPGNKPITYYAAAATGRSSQALGS